MMAKRPKVLRDIPDGEWDQLVAIAEGMGTDPLSLVVESGRRVLGGKVPTTGSGLPSWLRGGPRRQVAFSLAYRTRWYLFHPHKLFREIVFDCRSFLQRGLYGVSTHDCASLDYYLATWLPWALRQYRTHGGCRHTYPPAAFLQMLDYRPEDIASGDLSGDTTLYEKAEPMWDHLIEKMATGWETYNKKGETGVEDSVRLNCQEREGIQHFLGWLGALWD